MATRNPLPSPPTYAQVALTAPFHEAFDYLIPEGWNVQRGQIVLVPFGKRTLPGLILSTTTPTIAPDKIKPLTELSYHPPLAEEQVAFLEWMADYTLQPLGMILKMFLSEPEALLPRKARQRGITPTSTLTATKSHALSAFQLAASEALSKALTPPHFKSFLLDGVTGSGKTEVYFSAIEQLLADGKQILVLLPEIGLTVQWLERFHTRFGHTPFLWHSEIPAAQRREQWRSIAEGTPTVVVGARSALFLPFRNLSLIIVDEEHDSSYKQEEQTIYHARDMAVARAKYANIPIVLASATPSLESFLHATDGKYQHLHLPERHGSATLPTVTLLDMRAESLPSTRFLSPSLLAACRERLERGEQSLLFLNRRGYAPLTLCRACGHRFQCPHCSSWLVMHQKKQKIDSTTAASEDAASHQHGAHAIAPMRHQEMSQGASTLICHHCDYHTHLPPSCPSCQAEGKFAPCGPGVQRIAEEVAAHLPEARVGLMASDALPTPSQFQSFIRQIESGEINLIIGTQMIAKGHHFPSLTLVGVVDADLGLSGGDLRAAERSFQLLHQVSGRAGRENLPGQVCIQTYQPQHPVMQALLTQQRDAFYSAEAELRLATGMPPFGRLAALILSGTDEVLVQRTAREIAAKIPPHPNLQVLGPAPAPFYRLRNHFRYRFLIKAPRHHLPHSFLRHWLSQLQIPRTIQLRVDVDPQSFL